MVVNWMKGSLFVTPCVFSPYLEADLEHVSPHHRLQSTL